jgi:GxxExxY protein
MAEATVNEATNVTQEAIPPGSIGAIDVPLVFRAILDACSTVALEYPLGAREQVLQSALEAELQSRNLVVRREVPVPIIHRGLPLGHDARGREDLVVLHENLYVILELKQGKRLEQKDFAQLYRYMHMRAGETRSVHGLLVLFGDTHTEAWYARHEPGHIARVRLMHAELAPVSVVTHDAFEFSARTGNPT